MVIYAIHDQQLTTITTDKISDSQSKFNFNGNLDHLLTNPSMYHVKGDTIELDPDYINKRVKVTAFRNLQQIRENRKPLLTAFDTLEMKRKFILDGFIAKGEFPFIDSMTPERWEEIKHWRDTWRNLPDTDLLNVNYPDTPEEITYFL